MKKQLLNLDMDDYELVVSEGKLPYWRAILATACLFLFLFSVYKACWPLYAYPASEAVFKHFAHCLQFVGFGFAGTVYFSMQKTVLIDTDKNLLISKYNIGPVNWKKESKVPKLEYVSFYCKPEHDYHVNLWYEGNKHYQMYAFGQKEAAQKFARYVAKKLGLDLLDATEKGNSKWIETNA